MQNVIVTQILFKY